MKLACPTEAIAWVAGLFEGEGTLNISYDRGGWLTRLFCYKRDDIHQRDTFCDF